MRTGGKKGKERNTNLKESIQVKVSEEFNTATNHHIIHVKHTDMKSQFGNNLATTQSVEMRKKGLLSALFLLFLY